MSEYGKWAERAKEIDAEDKRLELRALGLLETSAPKQAARDIELAKKSGVPRISVEAEREKYEDLDAWERMDMATKDSPKLRSWLLNHPDNYAVARDSTAQLSLVEKAADRYKRNWRAIGAHAKSAGKGFKSQYYGARISSAQSAERILAAREEFYREREELKLYPKAVEIQMEMEPWTKNFLPNTRKFDYRTGQYQIQRAEGMPAPSPLKVDAELRELGVDMFTASDADIDDALRAIASGKQETIQKFVEKYKKNEAERDALRQKNSTGYWAGDAMLSGVESLVNMGPSISAGVLTRNPALPSAMMGGQVYTEQYGAGVTKMDMDPREAQRRALTHAGVETLSERVPLGIIMKNAQEGTSPLWKQFAKGMAAEQVQEQVATHVGDAVDVTYDDKKTWDAYYAERPKAAAQTAIATVVASGAMNTVMIGAEQLAQRDNLTEQQLNDTSKQEALGALVDAVHDPSLEHLSSEQKADFVGSIVGEEAVTIDLDGVAEALQEKGVDPNAILSELGADPDALEQKWERFGEEDIDLPTLLSSPAMKEHRDAIQPHLRAAGDTLTPAQREALQGEVKKAADGAEVALDSQDQQSDTKIAETVQKATERALEEQQVEQMFREMRQASGMYEVGVLDADSTVSASMVNTLAARLGMSPLEAMDSLAPQMRGSFNAEGLADGDLEQAWQEALRETGFQDDLARGTEPFNDDRLTPRINKYVEMARNGYSNAEIAEEFETTTDGVKANLSKARKLGIEIPRGKSAQKGDDRALIEALIEKGLSNAQISERTGKTPNHVRQVRFQMQRDGALHQLIGAGPLVLDMDVTIPQPGRPDASGFITSAEKALANPPPRFRDAKALRAEQWRVLFRDGGATKEAFDFQIEPALNALGRDATDKITRDEMKEAMARARPDVNVVDGRMVGALDLEYSEFVSDGPHKNYRQELVMQPKLARGYWTHHWTVPAVSGHIRTTDRITKTGEELLWVEELQSDLHQEAVKDGYAAGPLRSLEHIHEDIDAADVRISDYVRKLYPDKMDAAFYDEFLEQVGDGLFQDGELVSLVSRRDELLIERNNSLLGKQVGIPRAGMKSWEKPFIRHALQRGMSDGRNLVAFTNHKSLHSRLKNAGTQKFYDHRLPAHIRKVAKELGATVETVQVEGMDSDVLAIRLTPEAKAKLAEGNVMFQSSQSGARGSYSPAQRLITITESRHASTFMHEMSHWWLDEVHKIIQQGDAPKDLQDMHDGILKWAKVGKDFQMFDEFGQITPEGREVQEKFAETFETYLETGKAPTPRLREAFRTFKMWLANLWKALSRGQRAAELARADLNPDIAAIMDRMLATDEEIEATALAAGEDVSAMTQALLEKGVFTEKEAAKISSQMDEAREQAKETMLKKLMGDIMRQKQKWWNDEKKRTKGDVTREFDTSQVGRAYNMLGHGAWKGDEPTAEVDHDGLRQFVGQKSALPEARKRIEMAIDMERAGATREEIWEAHMVYRGVDGEMRAEVEDGIEILPIAEQYFGENQGAQGPVGEMVDLGPLLGHYPEFASQIRAQFNQDSSLSVEGGFGFDGDGLILFAEADTAENLKSVILHELQHAIQLTEGWARGSSPSAEQQRIGDKVVELIRLAEGYEATSREFKASGAESVAKKRAWLGAALREKADRLAMQDPFARYEAAAGEVEARNVQKRMNLPMEERRTRPPWTTDGYTEEGKKQYVMKYVSGLMKSIQASEGDALQQEVGAPQSQLSLGDLDRSTNLSPGPSNEKGANSSDILNASESISSVVNAARDAASELHGNSYGSDAGKVTEEDLLDSVGIAHEDGMIELSAPLNPELAQLLMQKEADRFGDYAISAAELRRLFPDVYTEAFHGVSFESDPKFGITEDDIRLQFQGSDVREVLDDVDHESYAYVLLAGDVVDRLSKVDVDGISTAREAFEHSSHHVRAAAFRAALDAAGVKYRTDGYIGTASEYIYIEELNYDETGEEVKIRFADHERQSRSHDNADFNFFNGSFSAEQTLDILNGIISERGKGVKLFQRGDPKGWGEVTPPPNVPPMRLDLAHTRDAYGEEILKALPREIIERSASGSSVDSMMSTIRGVKKSLKKAPPKSLHAWIRAKKRGKSAETGQFTKGPNGISDASDELRALNLEGLINEKSGTSIDYVREAAIEDGYLPEGAQIRDLLDLIAQEGRGESVYSIQDQDAVNEMNDARAWDDYLEGAGIDIWTEDEAALRTALKDFVSSENQDAMTADDIAEVLGISDGQTMLKALARLGSRAKFIKAETQRRMIANHGDMMADGTFVSEAEMEATSLLTEYAAEIEMEALAIAAGQNASSKLAKDMAVDSLSAMSIREMSSRIYRFKQAEQREMRNALAAMQRGDVEKAFIHKRRQMVNMHLHREGEKLLGTVEKQRRKLREYETKKTKRETLARAGQSYLDQMDDLLDAYRLRKEGPKAVRSAESLHAWATEQLALMDPLKHIMPFNDDAGNELDPEVAKADPLAALNDEVGIDEQMYAEEQAAKSRVFEALAEGSSGTHYSSLTVAELEMVEVQADMIYNLARTKTRLLRDGKRRSLKKAVAQAVESILSNKDKDARAVPLESDLPAEKRRRQFEDYMAAHRTLISLLRQMDGGKDDGALQELIGRPLRDSFGELAAVYREMEEGVAGLFSVYSNAEKRSMFKTKVHVPTVGVTMTKQGILAIALNMGNLKNRQRMMDSEGWSESDLYALVDSLTERDWKFVKSVWAYLDSWYPQANKAHMRVHGLPMDKVEAAPVMTKYGEMEGGYYPIVFDPARSSKTAQRALESEAKAAAGRVGAKSRSGFTQQRTDQKVTIPLRYSVLDVVLGHLQDVAKSITVQEALIDVGRIAVDPAFEAAVRKKYGGGIYRQILLALREAKQGQEVAQGFVEQGLVHLRHGRTIVGLGLRFSTAALQVFGLSNSTARVGTYWVSKGALRIGETAASRESATKFVQSKSPMMANRKNAQQREIADLRNKFKGERVPSAVKESFFWMITASQFHLVDMPTWLGQYEKSLAAGFDEVDAISHADAAVEEAQGTGEIYGLAGIQRGSPLLKLFTNFISYMVTTYNIAAQKTGNTNFKDPKQVMHWALDMAALMVWPVITKMLLDAALKGAGPDEDDEETWLGLYTKQQIGFLMSMNFFTGQVSGMMSDFRYDGPVGTAGLKDIEEAGRQIREGIEDEDQDVWDAARPALGAAGTLLHLPTGQLDTSIQGLQGIFSGESDDYSDILFGPDKETREAMSK